MNNNRGNNRRRGRGNNRQQGGGQQTNRIDSRARGNAPQLLEKYRKLAHDAHLNGDRVTEEYYLQFADHYFRVIADTRVRQEEARARREDRWQDGEGGERYDAEDAGEMGGENEYAPYEQHTRHEQAPRRERNERQETENRAHGNRDEAEGDTDATSQRTPYEPVENPFVRSDRAPRGGLKPRRENREERRPRRERDEEGPTGLDPATLPPAISAVREETPATVASGEEAEAKPRRRTRRTKPAADDAGDALEVVN